MDYKLKLYPMEELKKIYAERKEKYKIIYEKKEKYIDETELKKAYNRVETQTYRYKCYKEKSIGEQFEDRVWCALYEMGFEELTPDRQCEIYRNENVSKQIDIIARTGNLIVLIECKTSESERIRDLGENIDQIGLIKKEMQSAGMHKFFEKTNEGKLTIVWIYVVENITLSANDRDRAKMSELKVIDNWGYYEKLTSAIGSGAKYQFLADIFKGREIPNLVQPVNALKGKMGDDTFYLFLISPADLLKISFVPHMGKTDESRLDTYQRLVEKSRIKKIAEYITEEGGVFPTNIVVNFDVKPQFERNKMGSDVGTLYIPNVFKSAHIIDGQHRLYSYAGLKEAETAILPVIAFDEMDRGKQSELFVNINAEQKKVKRSNLDQISAYQNWSSDSEADRMIGLPVMIIESLNEKTKSIFYKRISSETKATNTTMTFGELSKTLKGLKLFGTRGRGKNKAMIYPEMLFCNNVDESLEQGVSAINQFFGYFYDNSLKFKQDWDRGNDGIMSRNGVVVPLLRIFKEILSFIDKIERVKTVNQNLKNFMPIVNKYQNPLCVFFENMDDSNYNSFKSMYGEGGYSERVNIFACEINKTFPSFMSREVEIYRESKKTHREPEDHLGKIKDMERKMLEVILVLLKRTYGDELKQWWHNGIPEGVRTSAEHKAIAKKEYQHFERYLDLIDFYEIFYKKENYDVFSGLSDLYDQKGKSKDTVLKWIKELNEIRPKLAHGPREEPTDEELDYVDNCYDRFKDKYDLFVTKNDIP